MFLAWRNGAGVGKSKLEKLSFPTSGKRTPGDVQGGFGGREEYTSFDF